MKAREHPQQVSAPAAPGSLLKTQRKQIRLRGAQRKAAAGINPSYLALIRRCPCLCCGMDPCEEAAHLRMQSGKHGKHGGMGKKPADRWALPLCHSCHMDQHKEGEREFWYGRLGVDPHLVANLVYAGNGDIERMRAIVLASIAARG
jgi:hypothetical protein